MRATQVICPRGRHGLRKAWVRQPEINASISLQEDVVLIELSDGRRHCIDRAQRASDDAAISSAVQWARRQGASAMSIDW